MPLSNTEFYPAQEYYIYPMKELLDPLDDPTAMPDDSDMLELSNTDVLLELAKFLDDEDVVMMSGDNPDTCIIWLDLDKETCTKLIERAENV